MNKPNDSQMQHGDHSKLLGKSPSETNGPNGIIFAHRASLFGFVLRRTRDAALSEDIVQETFAKLLVAKTSSPILNMAAFSYRVAENLIRDHYRRAVRISTQAVSDDLVCANPTSEQIVMSRQRLEQFQTIISKMPPLRREVFLRRRMHGQSHAEIATALGLSVASVEKHVVRAITWLSERMDNPFGEGAGS